MRMKLEARDFGNAGFNAGVRHLVVLYSFKFSTYIPIMATLAFAICCLMAGADPMVLASKEGEPLDPFAAASEVLKYSFEESDDRNIDGLPDDWTRRRGAEFPAYIQAEIDVNHGHSSHQSLHIKLNGGRLTYYSPFNNGARVDSAFNYVFRGWVRTERLQNDGAMISVSFLNHRKERLQRFVTRPVSGTHKDWVRLDVGPIEPHPDARFILVGCHCVPGSEPDLKGDVWFDDLWIGRLPRLKLNGDLRDRYARPDSPIRINAEVSGIEPGVNFELFMSVADIQGQVIDKRREPILIPTDRPSGEKLVLPFRWTLPPQPYGHYRVLAHLDRDGRLMLLGQTTFAVLDEAVPKSKGEFGWSLPSGWGALTPRELAFIASQGGVHWLKLPLWIHSTDGNLLPVNELLDELADKAIEPVGLLNTPPAAITKQFARPSVKASDVFTQSPEFWKDSISDSLGKYSSSVSHWQLGDDDDTGLQTIPNLEQAAIQFRAEFDRSGRIPAIGLPWMIPNETPIPKGLGRSFLSYSGTNSTNDWTDPNLAGFLNGPKPGETQRWITLRTLPATESTDARATQLVRSMIAARVAAVPVVCMANAMDSELGVLRNDGAPGTLFLPWRTAALALEGSKYLGSMRLKNRTTNHVFERNSEAVIVFLADQPTNESLNLGERVVQQEIWGKQSVLPRTDGKQTIAVGTVPVFCMNCTAPLPKWNLAVGFENVRLASQRGAQPNAILGRNTFTRNVSMEVSLKLPRGWDANPSTWSINAAAGETFRLPTEITLSDDASLGDADVTIDFQVVADRSENIEVVRTLEVGLGDVVIDIIDRKRDDGRLELEQIVINNTKPEEVLEFRCNLSVSGQKRQTRFVSGLKHGEDRKLYFLPNAEALKGQELWLNLEQINGRRNLNKRLVIGREWK